MKLFLDSTDIDEIKKYSSYGIVDGITTNPTLFTGSGGNFYKITEEICSLISGDVSIEVASNDYENMIIEGKKITAIAKNIALKLPVTWDGIRACRYFADNGAKVNMTLCFSASQALLAAKAGAEYVSPFIGRLEDSGEDGIALIADIRDIYDNYKIKTKILAASIRTPEHVSEAAICGADVATIPTKVFSLLLVHPLTDSGLRKFNEDWAKSGMKI
jgi:transaldolase